MLIYLKVKWSNILQIELWSALNISFAFSDNHTDETNFGKPLKHKSFAIEKADLRVL